MSLISSSYDTFCAAQQTQHKASIRDRHRFLRQYSGRHRFRPTDREDRRHWMVKCRTQIGLLLIRWHEGEVLWFLSLRQHWWIIGISEFINNVFTTNHMGLELREKLHLQSKLTRIYDNLSLSFNHDWTHCYKLHRYSFSHEQLI